MGSNGTRLSVRFGRNAGQSYETWRRTAVPLSTVELTGDDTGKHRPLLALETSECTLSTAAVLHVVTLSPLHKIIYMHSSGYTTSCPHYHYWSDVSSQPEPSQSHY